jgi:hypothetical protein
LSRISPIDLLLQALSQQFAFTGTDIGGRDLGSPKSRASSQSKAKILSSLLVGAIATAIGAPAFALSWNYYSPQRDARFYSGADANFVGAGLDWSGVGVTQSGWWATMISDRYFLTSYHIGQPKTDISVDFYRTNTMDTSLGNFDQEHIDSTFGIKIAGTDLWLGRLDQAPQSWVKRYPLIQRQSNTNYISYLDPSIYVYGFSGAGSNLDYTRSYLGTNTINTFSNTYSDINGSTAIGLTYTQDANAGPDEVALIGGDSSGPTFVKAPGGGLALAGLHWQINQDGYTDSSVGAYIPQIVAADPEHVSVVTDLLGDLNGDYRVNFKDVAIFTSHWNVGTGLSYNDGDLNGDGRVNNFDVAAFGNRMSSTLFAPADFNRDQTVNSDDLKQIATHWHTQVTPRTLGDATGDGYVDQADVAVLNANWRFGTWTSSHPTNPSPADINGDGLVDDSDLAIWSTHDNLNCAVSACAGADVNHDGYVNAADFSIISAAWDVYGPADINHDLRVDNYDLSILLSHWSQKIAGGIAVGDLNGDGIVNAADFSIMADWWGRGVGNVSQMPSLANVPEPATALFAASALLWSPTTRRRR